MFFHLLLQMTTARYRVCYRRLSHQLANQRQVEENANVVSNAQADPRYEDSRIHHKFNSTFRIAALITTILRIRW